MRSIVLLLVLGGCALPTYQWSPYIELQRRDEEFIGHGTIQDDYIGYTLMVGARLVPDTRVHLDTIMHLQRNTGPAAPPIVIDHSAPASAPEPDNVGKALDKADSWVNNATWPGVGMLAMVALIIFLILKFRRPKT